MRSQMDRGIVAGFAHATSVTYVNKDGTTTACKVATTSYQAGQELAYTGRNERLLITVKAVFASVTVWTLYARLNRYDVNNPATWLPTEIMLARLDGKASEAIENTVAIADVTAAGADGGDCGVAFTTSSALLSGNLEFLVKADQAPAAGDLLLLAVDAL